MPPSYRVLKGKKFGMVISKLFGIINKTSLNKEKFCMTYNILLAAQSDRTKKSSIFGENGNVKLVFSITSIKGVEILGTDFMF